MRNFKLCLGVNHDCWSEPLVFVTLLVISLNEQHVDAVVTNIWSLFTSHSPFIL